MKPNLSTNPNAVDYALQALLFLIACAAFLMRAVARHDGDESLALVLVVALLIHSISLYRSSRHLQIRRVPKEEGTLEASDLYCDYTMRRHVFAGALLLIATSLLEAVLWFLSPPQVGELTCALFLPLALFSLTSIRVYLLKSKVERGWYASGQLETRELIEFLMQNASTVIPGGGSRMRVSVSAPPSVREPATKLSSREEIGKVHA